MGCGASSKAAGGEGKTGEAPAPEAPPKTEPAAPPKEPTPATGTTEPQKPAVAPEKPAEPAPTEPEKPAPPPEKPAEPAPTEPEKPSVSRSLDGCVIATHATFEGEYFYATLYDDGEGRRRVASWMSGGNPEEDPQSKWIIKTMEDGTLVITSAHFEGNYLYACANDDGEGRRYVKCWMNGGAAEEDPQARWAAKELADGSFTITSVLYEGNYLYAGGESLADGEGRRPVYCWMNGGEAAVDAQAKWKISAAAAPAAPAAAPAEEAPPPAEEAPPPAEEAPPAAEEAPAAEPEAPPAEPEATEAPAAEAEPASSGCFIITNPTFEGEYFYATLKDDGEGRRQVNQWMSGGDPEADPQSKWCMKEMEDGTLLITHAHFQGNYLYAANSDDGEGRRYVYAWMGGGAAEDDPQARWIMTKKEDGTCYITSKEYEGNYLYAANKDDGDGRRSVFCWSNGGAPEDDPQAIWTIAPAVAAPEPA